MLPKHSDPTGPMIRRLRNGNVVKTWAHAPYNFVPLPDTTVEVSKPNSQDSYLQGKCGYIECKITTLSPMYVRGMIGKDLYHKLQNYDKSDIAKNPELKAQLADFYSLAENSSNFPCIPGSTLRGMIRNLVEVISFSRIHNVAAFPKIWYRDVANSTPMNSKYKDCIGQGAKYIRAGVVEKRNSQWYICPLQKPDPKIFIKDKSYFIVHDNVIRNNISDLKDFKSLYSSDYSLQPPYRVRFNAVRGRYGNIITEIKKYLETDKDNDDYSYSGWLITTGNMSQGDPAEATNRKRKYLPVVFDKKESGRIKINDFAAESYINNITDEIRDEIGETGCLQDKNIIFYSTKGYNGEVIYFGHNPFFRVPLFHKVEEEFQAVTPLDFVNIKDENSCYMVDALFGNEVQPDGKDENKAYAGRLSFLDARFDDAPKGEDIWFKTSCQPHPLKILGTPKATAYAHYLVQDTNKGHAPNKTKEFVANYSTPSDQTTIRGHKFYWRKGKNPDFIEKEVEQEHMHTRANPINAGVVFRTRIYFTNLTKIELGALLWALRLPADENRQTCHQIGMGKPYGMGSVKIEPTLYLMNHKQKYQNAFTKNDDLVIYPKAEKQPEKKNVQYLDDFEKAMLKTLNVEGKFKDIPRIKDLLLLHTWPEKVDDCWRNETRYMDLEKFRELAILPTPQGVEARMVTCRKNLLRSRKESSQVR